MQALGVTEQILTIGRPIEDFVIEKTDSCLGAKPCCEPSRDPGDPCDLGLPMPEQFADQVEPPFGARPGKPDDPWRVQHRSISWTVRAIASSIRRANSCQVKRNA